jgi:magnesium and cobalt exporter, CNNM family
VDPDQPPPSGLFFLLFLPVSEIQFGSGILIASGVVLILLLLLSAIFSGSEVALFSLEPSDREILEQESDRASRRVLRLLDRPRELLVTILILNTIVNVATAILAAVLTNELAASLEWNPVLTVLGEIIALTFVLLIVSEITPKLLAARAGRTFARRVSVVLLPLSRVLSPVSRLLAHSMDKVHNRFKSVNGRISGEDLKAMADIGEAHGTIQEEEKELIHSIVEFGDTSVREIMISRLDVVALPAGATVSEAVDIIRSSGHSRLPLYVEHLDNILGVVYAKDLLRHITKHADEDHIDWTRLARPPMFVPLGKKLDDLLRNFQEKKTHIALVVDEYGGTAGVVTLEDVLEEIVGEIRDEHDESEQEPYEIIGPGSYRFDARIDLDELNEIAGAALPTDAFDFETLGGLIFHLAGEIPAEGDSFSYESLSIRVERVESHRIVTAVVVIEERTVSDQD